MCQSLCFWCRHEHTLRNQWIVGFQGQIRKDRETKSVFEFLQGQIPKKRETKSESQFLSLNLTFLTSFLSWSWHRISFLVSWLSTTRTLRLRFLMLRFLNGLFRQTFSRELSERCTVVLFDKNVCLWNKTNTSLSLCRLGTIHLECNTLGKIFPL